MFKKFSSSDIRSATAAFTCSVIFGILLGVPRMSTLLFVASMSRFGINRQQASFPFFLCYTIRNAFGPLIGYLGGKFGLKNVIFLGCCLSSIAVCGCFFAEDIVTITVLWGVAFGFSFGMSISFLPQVLSMHFSNHFDKAVGVMSGGECIASFPLTLLTKYLLKVYELSGTFLILSAIVLHTIPASMLIQIPDRENQNKIPFNKSVLKGNRNKNSEKIVDFGKFGKETNKLECIENNISTISVSNERIQEKRLDSKSSKNGFRVFLNPAFILLLLTQGTGLFIITLSNTILVDVSRDHGVSIDDAVNIFIGFQVADAIGRFTPGFITDRDYLSKTTFSAVCFAALAVLLVAFIWIRGFLGLMIFSIGFGIFSGGLNMISPTIVMQYVEEDCVGVAMASRCLLYTPISVTQAPLIGFFRDKLQSYTGLICILIAICCMNSILSLMIPLTKRCKPKGKDSVQKTCSSFPATQAS